MSQDLLGDVALAAHRVDGHDGAFDGHHVEQLGDGDDLVGLLRHLDLAEHEPLTRREGGDHVDRRLAALLLAGAARGLAVDGDHLALARAGQRGDPGDEAALERLGVERGEYVAEVIVRRRSVAKRPEPAQERELLLAEPGDVDEGLSPGQHRQKAQQKHLIERIHHLAALARVRQILEIAQKDDRFAKRPQSAALRVHRILRQPNQRITTDSALQPFVTHSFTRLPWDA